MLGRSLPPPPAGARAALDARRRQDDLDALAGGAQVDVLVVGGGITGAGIALDAASRGLSVALVERRDLAHGTSRWSSKLVHGGLRYLAQGDLGLAWESARERAALMATIAPHLTRPLPFLIPLTDDVGARAGALAQVGTRIGDGLRVASGLSRRRLPPPRRVSAHEARRFAPALREAGLRGAVLYWDGQLEDDARLVVGVARTAAAHGARIVTYAGVQALHPGGAEVRDERTGALFSVRARHTVNATGVWAAALAPEVALRPSKGAHLVVPAERLADPRAAVSAPLPGEANRWVFTLPRPDGLVLLGLTDDPFTGPIPDEPPVDAADEGLLLDTVNRALDVALRPEDVVGRFAGLRPLLAGADGSTADLSRRHAILEDPESGALTIVGGKLTTYRQMAEDVVDRFTDARCRTRRLPLVGAAAPEALDRVEAPRRLVRRYGTEALEVLAGAQGRPELLEPLAPGVPVCAAELRFGLRAEGALGLDDLLDRRTRLGLVPEQRQAAAAAAAALLPELAETQAGALRH